MNKFEAELKDGRFVVSECPKCKIIVWPPSNFCNKCFEEVTWRNSLSSGKLIEFSKKSLIFQLDLSEILFDRRIPKKNRWNWV